MLRANKFGLAMSLAIFAGLAGNLHAQYAFSLQAGGGPQIGLPANGPYAVPYAVAWDSHGGFYFSTAVPPPNIIEYMSSCQVFHVNQNGLVDLIIGNGISAYGGDGGPASAPTVQLNQPIGLALDVSGNLYIADSGNSRVRRVDAVTQIIWTVAGTGVAGYSGDGAQRPQPS
jgi:hypothetical protein